jgi:hypothetical protein
MDGDYRGATWALTESELQDFLEIASEYERATRVSAVGRDLEAVASAVAAAAAGSRRQLRSAALAFLEECSGSTHATASGPACPGEIDAIRVVKGLGSLSIALCGAAPYAAPDRPAMLRIVAPPESAAPYASVEPGYPDLADKDAFALLLVPPCRGCGGGVDDAPAHPPLFVGAVKRAARGSRSAVVFVRSRAAAVALGWSPVSLGSRGAPVFPGSGDASMAETAASDRLAAAVVESLEAASDSLLAYGVGFARATKECPICRTALADAPDAIHPSSSYLSGCSAYVHVSQHAGALASLVSLESFDRFSQS